MAAHDAPGGGLKKRIRVARIITRLNIGGPAIQAMLLRDRLAFFGYETLLISGKPGPREGDMAALRGVKRPDLELASLVREVAPPADAAAFVALVRALLRFRPHIVHTHLAKAGALGRVAARLASARAVVHTFHGNVLHGYFGEGASMAVAAAERLLARITDRVVAISPLQRAELERLGIGQGKITEIPLGFDLAPFMSAYPGALRNELGIDSPTPLVGIVARLVPVKGIDVFIDAAAELARRTPARFVIVGDGILREDLERRVRARGLWEKTSFLGWRADLPAIYADLDVVVQTSHNEGTPVSVIEAMAAARPVVATAVGGVPDLLDATTGTLAPAGDAHAVAVAVERTLAERGVAAERARVARRRVVERHSAERLVERVDALYRELLGVPAGPR